MTQEELQERFKQYLALFSRKALRIIPWPADLHWNFLVNMPDIGTAGNWEEVILLLWRKGFSFDPFKDFSIVHVSDPSLGIPVHGHSGFSDSEKPRFILL